MELAIDTSTNHTAVALSEQGELRAELSWHSHFNQSVELLPTVDYLLKRCSATQRDLQAIFVALGPGSFSGLRAGMSSAKGLAVALNIPVMGVGTLELEAFSFTGLGLLVRPLLDAGRNEFATALFEPGEDGLHLIDGPSIESLKGIIGATRARTLFCGEALSLVRDQLRVALGEIAVLPPRTALSRRIAALVELGWRSLRRHEVQDVATLQPIYLRKPSITVKTEPRRLS